MTTNPQTTLRLAPHVMSILDQCAGSLSMSAPELFRKLLLEKQGGYVIQRESLPTFRSLSFKLESSRRWLVSLPNQHKSILESLCFLVGGGSPSAVASHLILDLGRVSPLCRGSSGGIMISEDELTTIRDQSPKRIGFTVAKSVLEIANEEAKLHCFRFPTDFFADLLRHKLRIIQFSQYPKAKKRVYLPVEKPQKVRYNLTLPERLTWYLDEICARGGNMDRGTVISHLVLDYARISPLDGDFKLQNCPGFVHP